MLSPLVCEANNEIRSNLHLMFYLISQATIVSLITLLILLAQRLCHLRLVRMFWNKWSSALHHKQREENRWHAAGHWAVQSTQRKALEHWKACILNMKQTLFYFHATCSMLSSRLRGMSACKFQRTFVSSACQQM